MLLTPEDADLLFRLHRTLMFFVNQRLEIVADIGSPDELSSLSPETRLRVRDAFLEHVDLIESFVSENPAGLPQQELEIVGSWRDLVAGRFIILRQLKKHAILLSLAEPQVAYGVLAATEPLELVIGPGLPYMADAVLLPFPHAYASPPASPAPTSISLPRENPRGLTTPRARMQLRASRPAAGCGGVPIHEEEAAYGAALLAGSTTGVWHDLESAGRHIQLVRAVVT